MFMVDVRTKTQTLGCEILMLKSAIASTSPSIAYCLGSKQVTSGFLDDVSKAPQGILRLDQSIAQKMFLPRT